MKVYLLVSSLLDGDSFPWAIVKGVYSTQEEAEIAHRKLIEIADLLDAPYRKEIARNRTGIQEVTVGEMCSLSCPGYSEDGDPL